MPGITADLELRAEQAMRSVAELDQALARALQTAPIDLDVNTAGLAAEIDAAFGTADSTIEVEADTTQAVENVERLDRQVDDLGGTFKRVAGVAAGLFAGRELLEFGRESVEVASNLAEQVSAAEVVFGEADATILAFGETSAQSIGVARDEAIELSNSLGGLLTALGLTTDEAAGMGVELIERAADVASLRNVVGGAQSVVEKFNSALVGEAEPVREFGVVINEATVATKAMELGLGGANRELTEAEKVQARYALILEGTAVAQGNFAATADGVANAQRIATAEWREARGEIGEQLIPVMVELLGVARQDLIPALQELGERAAPIVAEAFRSAGPLIETALSALEGLAPVASLVVDVLNAIPDEVLATATSFGALGRILRTIGPSISATSGSLLGMHPAVAGVAIGLTALTTIMGRNSRAAEEERQRVEAMSKAFLDLDENVSEDVVARATEGFRDLADELRAAGVTVEDVADAARAGGTEWETMVDRIVFGSGAGADEIQLLKDQLQGFNDELDRGAEQAIDEAVALGLITDAQARAAEKGQTHLAALEALEPAIRAAGDAGDEFANDVLPPLTEETEDATTAIDAFREALDATLDPFLTAEEATLRFRSAQRDLLAEIEDGPRKGETLVAFHERLKSGMLDLIDTSRRQAEALLSAGEFDSAAEAADFLRLRLFGLTETFPALAPVIQDALKEIETLSVDMQAQGDTIGGALSHGIGIGIKRQAGEAVQAAREVAGQVITVVSGSLRIESPSKVAMDLGAQFSLGMAAGIRSEIDAVSAASTAMAAATVPAALVPAFSVGVVPATVGGTAGAAASGGAAIVNDNRVSLGPFANVEMDPVLVAQHLARRVP